MNKIILSSVVFGIALMLGFSVLPAMGFSAIGTITFVNPVGNFGLIDRPGENENGFYHFFIPEDLLDPDFPIPIGRIVLFDFDPENSRHAINIRTCVNCGK